MFDDEQQPAHPPADSPVPGDFDATEELTETGHSDRTTEGIRIEVASEFRPAESDPDHRVYLYRYRVRVTNVGDQAAQLLSRHWIIQDALGERRDVRGDGVVGAQPLLEPGEAFQYDSNCPLNTEWGTMEGSYAFERPDGTRFDAVIGRFFLAPNTAPLPAV